MVKLLLTDSYYEIFNILTNSLKGKVNSLEGSNLVFCEEKISLMAERRICAEFGGSFNTDVYSFGNYLRVNKYLSSVLSKEGSAMVVKRLLSTLSLGCFKSSATTLAPSLFDLIIQLKSASITPDDLKYACQNLNGVLKGKLLDVATVFEEYEKYLLANGLEDQSSMLSYLPQVFESQDLANTDVYLLGFSSLTKQARLGIEVLLKKAKSVTAILVEGQNDFAYLNETSDLFRKTCQELGVAFEEKSFISQKGKENQVILNNLFNPLVKKERLQTDKVYTISAKTLYEEMENVAITIKREVINGNVRYKDVGVVLADPSLYKDYLKECFNRLDIPYFLDEKKKPSNHPLIHLILDYIDVFRKGFNKRTLCSLVVNPLLGKDKTFTDSFVKHIKKYNLFWSSFTKPFAFLPKDSNLANEFELYRKKIVDCCAYLNVEQLLNEFEVEKTLQEFTSKLTELGQTEESAVNEQIYQAIVKILGEMKTLLGEVKLTPVEFRNVFLSGVEALELSIIPQYNDAVFVGGFKEASLGLAQYLFVPGLTNEVPSAKDDVALLTDSDIDALANLKVMIEPKIKVVNHRERQNVALGVSAFSQKLFVSYPLTSRSGAKNIKGEVYSFITDNFTCQLVESFDGYLTKKQAVTTFAKTCSDYYEGLDVDFTDANAYYSLDVQQGLSKLALESAKNPKIYLESGSRVLIDGETSPTMIENYHKCPYMTFLSNGLRLSQEEDGEMDVLSCGNLMHEIFALYLKNVDKVSDKISSDALFELKSKEVLAKDEYKRFLENEVGASAIERAFNECKKFCYKIYCSLAVSKFKAEHSDLEVGFGDGDRKKYPAISLLGGKVKLSGKIDRVDTMGDYCRIIDYKTGSADASGSKLFAGVKLQLYLYGNAVKDKKIAGMYYLPVNDAYRGEDKKNGSLVIGKTLNDENVMFAQDQMLSQTGKSEIIPVTIDEEGKISGASSKENMDAMVEYALKISEKAVSNMNDGVIVASPFEKSCEYCQYGALCGVKGTKERKVRTVSEDVIYKSVQGEKE